MSVALFPHQDDLPPLPLPELSDTLQRYLRSVEPLLTADEYAHTSAVVTEFGREGGEGEALQAFLEEKASNERNWMEEWWEQFAYLRGRTTMAIHINWTGPQSAPTTQSEIATAELAHCCSQTVAGWTVPPRASAASCARGRLA